MTFIQNLEADAIAIEHQVANWLNTNPVGLMIEQDAKACILL